MFNGNMEFYTIIFGAFLELIILQTAKADIPGCHYLDTVSIKSSQRLENGSYLYQDIEIPEYLTGQYDYIATENGFKIKTESRLRGCVCQLKPCIWICCRFKDWNGKCTDGLVEELSGINPFLKVTLNNGSVVKRNLIKDFIVSRYQVWSDAIWKVDKFTLFENGSVLLNGKKGINFRGYDCLHPNQFTSDNIESLVAAFHPTSYFKNIQNKRQDRQKQRGFMWLSEVFLALTIAVYLKVRKLRNLHGKCFICYMIATFINCILYIHTIKIPLHLCALYGYLRHPFEIAKFMWLLALSHQLWRGLTSVNRAASEYSFGAYSIFAWGLPAIWMGVVLLIDYIWDRDASKVNWVPGIGWKSCGLKSGGTLKVYLCWPIRTLIVLNTILIILTTISIVRVKLSLKHFSDQDERARNLSSRMHTYKAFLRLIVLMDIQWSVRAISVYVDWDLLRDICDYCNSCIGIIIFVLFVLKRSTLKLLWESF